MLWYLWRKKMNDKNLTNWLSMYLIQSGKKTEGYALILLDSLRDPRQLWRNIKITFWMMVFIFFFINYLLPAMCIMVSWGFGNYESLMEISDFQPGKDHMMVTNKTDHHISFIQYKIPLYQCPSTFPYYFGETVDLKKSGCYPIRAVFMNDFINIQAKGDFSPGEKILLTPNDAFGGFDRYLQFVDSNDLTAGFHPVEGTPVYVGADN